IAGVISGIVVAVFAPIASSASSAYFAQWAEERHDHRVARAKLLEDARLALTGYRDVDQRALASLVPAIGDSRLSDAFGKAQSAGLDTVGDEIGNVRHRIGELIREESEKRSTLWPF